MIECKASIWPAAVFVLAMALMGCQQLDGDDGKTVIDSLTLPASGRSMAEARVKDRLVCFQNSCGTSSTVQDFVSHSVASLSIDAADAYSELRKVDRVVLANNGFYDLYSGKALLASLRPATQDGMALALSTAALDSPLMKVAMESIDVELHDSSNGLQEVGAIKFTINSCDAGEAVCDSLVLKLRFDSFEPVQ